MTGSAQNPEGPARAFRVLVVCTANQCRSPMAEYLLRDALRAAGIPADATADLADGRPAAGWSVGSAGTRTRGGRPMDPAASTVLAERGIDGSGFVGRALTPQLIRDADLVLAATREHRGAIASLLPAALSRLFTIQQFGYLAAAAQPGTVTDPVDAGFDLLARARAARSQVPGRTVEDDLADPVGRPVEDFRRCAGELDDAIRGMLRTVPPR
ncbi:hypothetical protein [Nakamurella deserti]|uniref:arsenate reductase/protein-tyrosine-phosphatase family protein n=1 Tax=Nakamurella deserti TaxID=2164074 RepID=UPI00197C5D97|nr:hypothetical protein [Nakamurella deserti]